MSESTEQTAEEQAAAIVKSIGAHLLDIKASERKILEALFLQVKYRVKVAELVGQLVTLLKESGE